jgi:hypothetical protein
MLGMRKVRTERFLAKRRIALAAVLLAFPLVAGCPQEVPYASPDKGAPESGTPAAEQPATDEAPAFSPQGSPTAEGGAAADPSASVPEPAETAASDPAEAPPERLPWEAADKPAETPKEAGELFAAVDKPADTTAKPPAATEEEKEEEGDGFGDFLDDAYGSLEKEEPVATETEAEQQPTEEPKPTEELATATPPAAEPETKADDNWWQDSTATPPAAAPPSESPAAETPQVETPAAETTPEPKAPSATASSNADLLDELWGEETDTSAEAKEPEPAPAVETPTNKDDTTEGPTLPFDEPSQPGEGKSLFDEPEAEAPVETKQPEPLPEPSPAIERAAPMAADVMKPLPAVPVLEFNTRHLAWLLGGKLGLAELADLDGATATEVAEWRREVARLAKSLKVADPSTGGAASAADERVKNMLDAASRAGAELTRAHGPDHAALMEIALKTNALLVVAKDHPDLAGSVGRAVEGAAERAMLPKFLWEDSVRVLKANPDADQAHDAVVRLHQRVESFLR